MLWPKVLIGALCWSLARGEPQPNASVQDVGPIFSQFDLFKNTGFHPCPSNPSTPSKRLVPRRGGGSHIVSSGSSGSRNNSDLFFIQYNQVKTETGFCANLKGIPIMIPTTATPIDFVPWWPTFTAHFLSLSITYFGLWRTAKEIRRDRRDDMPLPIFFWIQLPFDMTRVGIWLFKAIHGFLDTKRYTWIRYDPRTTRFAFALVDHELSVVIWLVLWNYLWLLQLLKSQRQPREVRMAPIPHSPKEQFRIEEQYTHLETLDRKEGDCNPSSSGHRLY